LQVAVAQAAERTDPASHQITAAEIAHVRELFERPQPDEGFTLHVIDRTAEVW
jgi:hypothetical protein